MKIKTVLFFLALTLLFACDPKGNHQTNGEENNLATEETKKTPPTTDAKEKAPIQENVEKETATPVPTSPNHYICYKSDGKSSLALAIGFDENDKAINVKYKGQEESMQLSYLKEDMETGGAHPNIYTYYTELYEGQENGVYKLTHSGVWDYAEYTRKKDGKQFNFTIDHDLTVEDGGYRKTPCY